jgi:hypothetical protein
MREKQGFGPVFLFAAKILTAKKTHAFYRKRLAIGHQPLT